MKLVLYSGGTPEQNIDLDSMLLRMLGSINPRITLVPSAFHHTDEDYEDFREQFEPHRLHATKILHTDRVRSEHEVLEALDTDMIFLSGGNTFYFLESLRKSKIIKQLQRFAKDDGLLAGRSAGAILMTPSIHTAGMPDFDRDENETNLRNLKAMDLVNFEFFPHYTGRRSYDVEFESYSEATSIPLYAATDGSGIVVHDRQVIFVGDVVGFVRGAKFRVSSK